ncbi:MULTISPECIES: SpaA isopeptide-forming pilin-related protein [unclassified Bifidobacterium]|uniref:SpaA isopeptide-forming pilin-related protein n=1 Tax=unclassified Bifidobacterium TaxID=2608897 RepID=UPI0023F7D65E|nr:MULTISPECIES: SpaA isopeptide-forming pilin-related protein [unclassified Bifidobacterium]WEV65419.1 SpaA isopeptide-forming pilin-related protein [Bifidobacterium sp. ESL0764]WEV75777.1 SpaA isopeptide-forming pilin-related protein [Bifidobacterium sp. ESL0800]
MRMNGLAKALTSLAACVAMLAMGATSASALETSPSAGVVDANPFISSSDVASATGRVAPAADTTGIKTTQIVENNTNTYDVGSPIVFTVGSKVPIYTFATDFTLKVNTTLSKGLTYDPAKAHPTVTIGGQELNKASSGTGYQLTADTSSSATKLTFDFSSYVNSKITNLDYSLGTEPIKITYTAYLNAKAFTGNDADATTSKSETEYNDTTGVTCKDVKLEGPTVKLYTGGFTVDKISKTTGKALPGAKFQIRRKDAADPLKFVRSGGEGTASADYILPEAFTTATTTDTLVVPQSGQIEVEGLADGVYTVKETHAPNGYMLPTGFSFNVTLTHNFDASNALTGVSYSQTGDLYGLVKQKESTNGFTVSNVQSFKELPASGAAGILMRVVIGLVLLAIAAIGYALMHRNKKHSKPGRFKDTGYGRR